MKRSEWLRWRSKGLGASDAPIVLGLTPWSSPTELCHQKRGEAKPLTATDRMEWGLLCEPALTTMAEQRYGWRLAECEHMTHPDHEWARCTPDRFRVTDDGPEIVELKVCWRDTHWGDGCTAIPHAEPGGNVPVYYYIQVQWQLFVCQLHVGWLVGMVAGNLRRYRVQRDDDLIAAMFEKLKQFWVACVIGGEEPYDDTENGERFIRASQHDIRQSETHQAEMRLEAINAKRLACDDLIESLALDRECERLREQIRGLVRPGDTAWSIEQKKKERDRPPPIELPALEDAAQIYQATAAEINALKKTKQAARNEILRAMEGHGRARAGSNLIRITSVKGRTRLDAKLLREERPEIAEAYTRTDKPTMRMTIKTEEN